MSCYLIRSAAWQSRKKN